MDNFEKIKSIVLKSAKENGAREPEYKNAFKSANLSELCNVLKENFNWGCNNGVITSDLLERFKDDFSQNDIWINCNVSNADIFT